MAIAWWQVLKGKLYPAGRYGVALAWERNALKATVSACRTIPLEDSFWLNFPPQSLSTPQRTQVEGEEITVQTDHW